MIKEIVKIADYLDNAWFPSFFSSVLNFGNPIDLNENNKKQVFETT